jgi:hypothetical protein
VYELAGASATASSGSICTVSLRIGVTPSARPVSIDGGGRLECCSADLAEVGSGRSVICAVCCDAESEGDASRASGVATPDGGPDPLPNSPERPFNTVAKGFAEA